VVPAQLVVARGKTRVELDGRLLEPRQVRLQRSCPLDERRMRRLGLGGTVRLRLHRFARVKEAPLRPIQVVVGRLLIHLDADDGLAGLLLAGLLGVLFFVRGSALRGDLRLLSRNSLRGFAGRSQLQLEPDHRFFLPVLLALKRHDGGLDRCDADVEPGDLLAKAFDQAPLFFAFPA
jgi:hypothetical protein